MNARSNAKSYEEQMKLAADGLRTLCEYGDKQGINVIVENHGGLSSNGAWMSKVLADERGDTTLYDISEAIETVMWDEKKLFANADFFAASVYHFMGIPTYLFTPIFVCSRITGWAAHVMEQRADNKLIRPAADYIGPGLQEWTPIEQR